MAQVIKKGSEFINQAIKPGRRNRSNSGNGKSKTFEYKPRSEDETVKIPESYNRIDISKLKDAPLPEDAEGYTIATGNASGIVFCYPVTAEASMPLDDSQKIIDFLHETMDENQGIIEVKRQILKSEQKTVSRDNRRPAMKQISNKEYEKYQQYKNDKRQGRCLTPDGLRVICAGLDNDPEKIGIHMLEMVAKFRSEGIYDILVDGEE